jgi:uncharacterized protein
MRVFLDANILFSAADEGSATRQLLDKVFGCAEVLTNPHALEEARRNLRIKRPQQLPGLESVEGRLRLTEAFAPSARYDVPEEDVPILNGAVSSHCTHLWTSDRRHFGKYYGTRVEGVLVVSSVMLSDIVRKG